MQHCLIHTMQCISKLPAGRTGASLYPRAKKEKSTLTLTTHSHSSGQTSQSTGCAKTRPIRHIRNTADKNQGQKALRKKKGRLVVWVWAGMLKSPAGVGGAGSDKEKKHTHTPFPKRKTLPTVCRIFQSLAHMQKSNTTHFKASWKILSISRSHIQIAGTRTREAYSIMLCAVLLKICHKLRRSCGISTHLLKGKSDKLYDESSSSLIVSLKSLPS